MKRIVLIISIICRSADGSPEYLPPVDYLHTSGTSDSSSDEAERQREIREQLQAAEIAWKNADLSGYSTSELLRMALAFQSSPASTRVSKELEKRPDEVRAGLARELDKAVIPFDILYRIPFVAGNVDTEFQVEIAKRCLFRNEMKEADLALRLQEDMGKGIFSLIAQSKNDETAVLDRLIAEGRLEKGSDFELRWRARLSNLDTATPAKGLQPPRSKRSYEESPKESGGLSFARKWEGISLFSWSMGAILAVASIGLLWFLLKKAKV